MIFFYIFLRASGPDKQIQRLAVYLGDKSVRVGNSEIKFYWKKCIEKHTVSVCRMYERNIFISLRLVAEFIIKTVVDTLHINIPHHNPAAVLAK